MNLFPASSSILAEKSVEAFLKQAYPELFIISTTLIKVWVNDTYLVVGRDQKFIFRIYRYNWRTKGEIQAELDFINLLNGKNIPVSHPIADRQNQWIQEFEAVEGMRYGVLFSYAKGEKRMNLSPLVHFEIGKVMAKIHKLSAELTADRITYNAHVLVENPFEIIKTYLNEADEELAFLLDLKNKIVSFLNDSSFLKNRKGIVHMDIWADNINITDMDDFTIFDFDFCGNGYLIFDYAYHLLMLFITTPDKRSYEEKAINFKKGYLENNILTNQEELSIPMVGAALLFYYLGFQCDKFKAIFVNKDYVKGYINSRIKAWISYFQQ